MAALVILGLVAPASATTRSLPETIPLPNGWQPEGIAIARDGTFYVGSIPTGAVYRGNVRTGTGAVLVQPQAGRAAIGLKVHHGVLFVAGGPTGQGYAYDAHSGRPLASWQLTTNAPTFINDVVVTHDAAWFTDSLNPVLYRVSLKHGRLASKVKTLPFSGDLVYQAGFNVNGIDAARGGKVLVVVQTNTGKLFTVNPRSGRTRLIDLGSESVPNGDGILLRGRTLFVVQNQLNLVAKLHLGRHLASGRVVKRIADPDFDVPTTIASFKRHLYVVNARFGTPPTPDTTYTVERVNGR
jgi:outer membrane protein assembly factor BamB